MQMQVDSTKIRKWREAHCWSQEHLAYMAGVSLRTIQRLENGESVSQETVMALAAALDVPPNALSIDAQAQAKEAAQAQSAKSKREANLGFWIHFVTYIGVIGLLFAINITSEREDLWAAWPAIGWGVGLFAHGAVVILTNRFSTDEIALKPLDRD